MRILNDFPYAHVLVLGLAKSGKAAAELLLKSNIQIRINDLNAHESDPTVLQLQREGADIVVGSHPLSVLDGIDLIVKNPGIPYDNVILKEAISRNIPIITEVELASRVITSPIIAITGSNGKTTTTTLITKMLKKSKIDVQMAGNIGIVATDVAKKMKEQEKMVLELSSFQLLGIQTLTPRIAVLLNIYEAHLDYHKSMANYVQAKQNIFKNQTESDYLIYNADDQTIRKAVKDKAKAKLIPFSTEQVLVNGIWADQTSIYFNKEKIIDKKEIMLAGSHNLENILAAVGAAMISGASIEAMQEILKSFSGVKHRLDYIGDKKGRLFYNDSKATNILATQKALAAFHKPLILLAGGLDRGDDFSPLIPFLKNVKGMVVFGETADQLKRLGEKANIQKLVTASDVKEAVEKAYQFSLPGDVILLSPACASWDQYKSFEERGDMFTQAMHTLT